MKSNHQFLTKPFVQTFQLPEKIQKKIKKEYKIIYPIKPRKIMFFGPKVTTRRKYFIFFGQEVDNLIKLYIPKINDKKRSKKEINKGKRR